MKYTKEKLRAKYKALMHEEYELGFLAGYNSCVSDFGLSKENQKPEALSLSDCNKIVDIVSDLLPSLLTQKSKEYMAGLIHAEMKKETT